MYENSVTLKKNRLTLRKVGQFLKKPLVTVDYQNLIDNFSKEFLSDSDDESEISNPLIDKDDKPERILTLLDYRKKMKTLGPDFKFIDEFSECYKNVAKDLLVQKQSNSEEKTEETFEDKTKLEEISHSQPDENLKKEFLDVNLPIPSIEKRRVMETKKILGTSELPTYWKLIEESKTSDVKSLELCEYDPEKTHWLDRPPVDWKVIEESKRKCLDWLSNYTY